MVAEVSQRSSEELGRADGRFGSMVDSVRQDGDGLVRRRARPVGLAG